MSISKSVSFPGEVVASSSKSELNVPNGVNGCKKPTLMRVASIERDANMERSVMDKLSASFAVNNNNGSVGNNNLKTLEESNNNNTKAKPVSHSICICNITFSAAVSYWLLQRTAVNDCMLL
jgi:hypothetical protein